MANYTVTGYTKEPHEVHTDDILEAYATYEEFCESYPGATITDNRNGEVFEAYNLWESNI